VYDAGVSPYHAGASIRHKLKEMMISMLLKTPFRRTPWALTTGLTASHVALPASLASAGTLPAPEDPTVEYVVSRESAVQVHQQDGRIFAVMDSSEAPSRFNFPVDAGADATVTVAEDGAAAASAAEKAKAVGKGLMTVAAELSGVVQIRKACF
jgi:hypothetical protein